MRAWGAGVPAAAVWIVAGLSLLLAGCGYRPLYGTIDSNSSVAAELAAVTIQEPDSRTTQLIRNELVSTMSPAGSSAGVGPYVLELEPEKNDDPAIIAFNADDIRRTVKLKVDFRLRDRASGKVVYSGKSYSQVSYDRVHAPFADVQARTNAEERAAREVGGDIRTRLAAYFASH